MFQTIPNRKHVRQILAYPDSTIRFSQDTFLLALPVSWGPQNQNMEIKVGTLYATKYQKGVNCIGVNVRNVLPFYIKAESDNPKKFKALLQKY